MRVLLLYISRGSGHHRASAAIAQALHQQDPTLEVVQLDAFQYTNPILARVINRTYFSILRTRPEVWDYLYDNPKVLRRVRALRELIHRYNSGKFKALLERFRPDVVACTQAFPCGMMADYKATFQPTLPLVGVLTDYLPHSYWLFDEVDCYVVASDEANVRMLSHGIPAERLRWYGIPIDPQFAAPLADTPVPSEPPLLLLMGGSTGFGPWQDILLALDRLTRPCRFHVVAGINHQLYAWCQRSRSRLHHPLVVEGSVDHVARLMRQAALLITKPGGLTTAEALTVGLPMVLINPIPGQEAKNAEFLLRRQAAVRARSVEEVVMLVDELLYQPGKRAHMRQQAQALSRPHAALDVARLLCQIAQPSWPPTPATASVSPSP